MGDARDLLPCRVPASLAQLFDETDERGLVRGQHTLDELGAAVRIQRTKFGETCGIEHRAVFEAFDVGIPVIDHRFPDLVSPGIFARYCKHVGVSKRRQWRNSAQSQVVFIPDPPFSPGRSHPALLLTIAPMRPWQTR